MFLSFERKDGRNKILVKRPEEQEDCEYASELIKINYSSNDRQKQHMSSTEWESELKLPKVLNVNNICFKFIL